MVLTPINETPEKPLENEGQNAAPHLSKPASLLNNDKTYTTICYNRFTNITVNIF